MTGIEAKIAAVCHDKKSVAKNVEMVWMSLEKMIQKTSEWVTGNGENAWKLVCPVCGYEYIHITAITCMRCTDETTITNQKILIKQSQNKTRGVTITLQYCCESGHNGKITLQFHEGCVYLTHRVLKETEAIQKDIWRD